MRHLVQSADVVGHELRTGGAVQADREQIGVRDRGVERVGGLAGEHRAHRFDGARDHHRELEAEFLLRPFRSRAARP